MVFDFKKRRSTKIERLWANIIERPPFQARIPSFGATKQYIMDINGDGLQDQIVEGTQNAQ